MSEPIKIWDDDGPEGEAACIELSAGGNGDWYVSVVGTDWSGSPLRSDGFRACTSGARYPIVTSCVALLAAIGKGDRAWALEIARGIVRQLERRSTRIPGEP